jgi:hypothetical protein
VRRHQVVPVFQNQDVHGDGVWATVELPALQTLRKFEQFYLDVSLSCPVRVCRGRVCAISADARTAAQGTRDEDCDIWDYTAQLYVNCTNATAYELGRWITPFRRRCVSRLPQLRCAKCTALTAASHGQRGPLADRRVADVAAAERHRVHVPLLHRQLHTLETVAQPAL